MPAADVFNIPAFDPLRTQVFSATASAGAGATSKHWQMWTKPPECSLIYIWMVGAGGGGGGGFTGAATTARGGGGGGGSGAISRGVFIASMLPNVLYIQTSQGGTASTGSGVAGGVGGRTYIGVRPSITAADLVMISGAADAGGGAAGTVAAGGAGGAAGTIATAALASFSSLAIGLDFIAGDVGVVGGAQTGAAGTAQVALATVPLTGGAGGGGVTTTDFAGGAITGAGIAPTRAGGTANAAGAKALNGLSNELPWYSLGGAGGGTDNDAVGGEGGDAGTGSGGGGGGGGATGGLGGRGGDGMCIIVAF